MEIFTSKGQRYREEKSDKREPYAEDLQSDQSTSLDLDGRHSAEGAGGYEDVVEES